MYNSGNKATHKKTAPDAGRPISLSGELTGKVRKSFGIDPSKLKLRESSEVSQMGGNATAQGNIIRFAPGKFNASTIEGQQRLGHELSHVVAQSKGGLTANQPGNIHFDPAHESASDMAGKSFATGGLNATTSVSPISASAAPIQGDGFRGMFHRKKKEPAAATAPSASVFNPGSMAQGADMFDSGIRSANGTNTETGKFIAQNKGLIGGIETAYTGQMDAMQSSGFNFGAATQKAQGRMSNAAMGRFSTDGDMMGHAVSFLQTTINMLDNPEIQKYIQFVFANMGGDDYQETHQRSGVAFDEYALNSFATRGFMPSTSATSRGNAAEDMSSGMFSMEISRIISKGGVIKKALNDAAQADSLPPEAAGVAALYDIYRDKMMQIGGAHIRDELRTAEHLSPDVLDRVGGKNAPERQYSDSPVAPTLAPILPPSTPPPALAAAPEQEEERRFTEVDRMNALTNGTLSISDEDRASYQEMFYGGRGNATAAPTAAPAAAASKMGMGRRIANKFRKNKKS